MMENTLVGTSAIWANLLAHLWSLRTSKLILILFNWFFECKQQMLAMRVQSHLDLGDYLYSQGIYL